MHQSLGSNWFRARLFFFPFVEKGVSLTRQPPWIGIEQFSKEILVVSGEEDLAPEGHLGDFWLFGLGFLSAAFIAFALFMTISRLQLFSLRKCSKLNLAKKPSMRYGGRSVHQKSWTNFTNLVIWKSATWLSRSS